MAVEAPSGALLHNRSLISLPSHIREGDIIGVENSAMKTQLFHNGMLHSQVPCMAASPAWPLISATAGCRVQYNFGQADFIYPQVSPCFHLHADPPPKYRRVPPLWVNPEDPPMYGK